MEGKGSRDLSFSPNIARFPLHASNIEPFIIKFDSKHRSCLDYEATFFSLPPPICKSYNEVLSNHEVNSSATQFASNAKNTNLKVA